MGNGDPVDPKIESNPQDPRLGNLNIKNVRLGEGKEEGATLTGENPAEMVNVKRELLAVEDARRHAVTSRHHAVPPPRRLARRQFRVRRRHEHHPSPCREVFRAVRRWKSPNRAGFLPELGENARAFRIFFLHMFSYFFKNKC
jgi:hypothetical protein